MYYVRHAQMVTIAPDQNKNKNKMNDKEHELFFYNTAPCQFFFCPLNKLLLICRNHREKKTVDIFSRIL